MSPTPTLRRTDFAMDDAATADLLARGRVVRLATSGPDGAPYCVPMLYVWQDARLLFHVADAGGHLRRNLAHDPRLCAELDEPGPVFDYGRFECDSSIADRSVIVHGTAGAVTDEAGKTRFLDALMAKYRPSGPPRPAGFYPRIGLIAVYAIVPEQVTGKQRVLPAVEAQWPAVDNTRTPNADAFQ